MNRHELGVAIMWLVPMAGAGILSVLVPPGGLLWVLAVGATVLSAANVALHLDLVAQSGTHFSPPAINRGL
jgi:hypothetical protein